ncbi:hypothetical protein HPB49_025858 [Dermacentor silvarum]|nr:hypothetical protein HPB49_025858 [Dermacentor silvarum]
MADPTSSPSPTGRTVGFPLLRSLPMLRHPRGRRLLTACVLVVVVTFVVGTLLLILFPTSRRTKLRESAVSGGQLFCCPEDARETASVVNASVSPCRDFFGRVCNRVIESKLWKQATQQAELERVMITGVFPRGVPIGKAGRFLTAYYKSCVETVPRWEAFVSELAVALAQAMREVLTKMNSRNAFLYATMASLKYGLPSAVAVRHNRNASQLSLGVAMRCKAGIIPSDVFKASIKALARVANASVTLEEVEKLTASMCSRVAAVVVKARTKQYRVASSDADEFDRTVWNVMDLRFSLRAVGYLVDNDTTILVHGVEEVRTVYNLYAADNVAFLGAKAAFLLLHSVEKGAWQFYGARDGSWPGVSKVCNESVRLIDDIWAKFVAELTTDPEKLDRIRAIFVAVKDIVNRDVSSSPIFQAEDTENLKHFFSFVSLDTPWTDVGFRTVAVPEPTLVFPENLLRARAYSFEVYRARWYGAHWERPRDDLVHVGTRHIFLRAAMNYFVRAGSGPSSEIPNMAIVGLLVAQGVWSMVLNYEKWTLITQDRIRRLAECYVEYYFETDKLNRWALGSMTVALGLASVLKAFDRKDWDAVRPAWRLLKMSHGEMFYTLLAYYRCPLVLEPGLMRALNVPLIFVEDFAKVFHCKSDSPMTKPQRCIIGADSRA